MLLMKIRRFNQKDTWTLQVELRVICLFLFRIKGRIGYTHKCSDVISVTFDPELS